MFPISSPCFGGKITVKLSDYTVKNTITKPLEEKDMTTLSELKIKSLKAKTKLYRIADGEGLFLEIAPSGKKKWRMRYSYNKKEFTFNVGEYPYVSLKAARAKLFELKILINNGLNPRVEKQKEITQENVLSFKEVTLDWIDKQTNKWGYEYKKTASYRLKRYAFGAIGDLPVADITAKDILSFLRKIEERGNYDTAHRLLTLCSQVFRYAVACGDCVSDPCRDLKGALTTYKATPRAALTKPKDVAKLMRLIHGYTEGTVKNAMFFSIYTFCRPGEIRHAEWDEIDLENKVWIIPAKKMKMRKEHKIPLSEQCIKILENMKNLHTKWVFPSRRAGKPLSEAGVLSAIRSLGYGKDELCAHGFRSIASTLLNEMDYKADLIEKALAHGDDNNIRGIYNRADYFDERRIMMQEWADYLDHLTIS